MHGAQREEPDSKVTYCTIPFMWLSKKGKHGVRKQINSCQERRGGGGISYKGHREHLG